MASVFAEQRGKLILAGVILLAVIVIFFVFQSGGGSPVADKVTYVCAATGKTYDISQAKVKWFPHRNPDTGEETLLPCIKREDGIYVSSRYRGVLEKLGDLNRCVDTKTLKVRTSR